MRELERRPAVVSAVPACPPAESEPPTPPAPPTSQTVTVHFPFNSADFQLTPVQETVLLPLLADVRRIEVRGRTDAINPSAADELVALKRAQAAKGYLISKGVAATKISINYLSGGDRVTENDSAIGRAQNRRVEIEIFRQEGKGIQPSCVFVLLALAGAVLSAATVQAGFSGDICLSCEALLCLSSGSRPSECQPSLRRYYGIHHKKLKDTLKARRNFLNLCPTASQDENMRKLVNDISQGAGRCDAATLNASLGGGSSSFATGWAVSDQVPGYCTAYNNNAYTDVEVARYVGTPDRGGYWVDPANYEQALREYNERIAREDAEQERLRNEGSTDS